jgi:hypothetical protein
MKTWRKVLTALEVIVVVMVLSTFAAGAAGLSGGATPAPNHPAGWSSKIVGQGQGSGASLAFDDETATVILTLPANPCIRIPESHKTFCTWRLWVNEPDENVFVGSNTGTSGTVTVAYPKGFCGIIQGDVSVGLPWHHQIGERHEVDTCHCP